MNGRGFWPLGYVKNNKNKSDDGLGDPREKRSKEQWDWRKYESDKNKEYKSVSKIELPLEFHILLRQNPWIMCCWLRNWRQKGRGYIWESKCCLGKIIKLNVWRQKTLPSERMRDLIFFRFVRCVCVWVSEWWAKKIYYYFIIKLTKYYLDTKLKCNTS